MSEETLEERLARLILKMKKAEGKSFNGELMVQRIEGDLMRIMNSASLNLSDLLEEN